MREDTETFLRRLELAFSQTVSGDNRQLAEALAYMNYLDSAGNKTDCQEALDTLGEDEISRLPLEAGRPSSGLCHLQVPLPKHPLYWVEDPKKVFGDRRISASMPLMALNFANKGLASLRRNLLWLSDLGGWKPGEKLYSTDTVLGMGLYKKHFEGGMYVFAVNVERLHKPTWVDAGFTFYWYAARETANHGLTRDLRDGKPRFKEWVVWKSETRITDLNAFEAPTASDLVEDLPGLNSEYIDRCLREVTDCRMANTGA